MANICSVCGYDGLYDPPIDERGISSDEICPCCGFHYGYDDDDIEDKKRYTRYGARNGLMQGACGFQQAEKLLLIGTL